MILVTGATGHLGQLVIDALIKRVPPADIVAGVRSLDKGKAFAAKGVSVRLLDYTQPATVQAAMAGVDKVLLISSSEFGQRAQQHAVVVDAAKRVGVKLLAYTSILKGDQSKMLIAGEHIATEQYIKASGVPYALLRNSWYIENHSASLPSMLQSGVMLGAAGEGKVAPAARVDYADAAAVVLTTPGHENKIYELAGDRGYTLADLAAEAARASGKPVKYQNLPPAELATTLAGFGIPKPIADILADADVGIARGDLNDTSGTLSRLIGRPTTSVADVFAQALR